MGTGAPMKERDYNILFLIDGEKKVVYLEPSFSKDPAAVLRKHLRGEKPETADVFSRESSAVLPAMWVWKAGCLTRKKVLVCLLKWQKIFRSEGYNILGMDIAAEKMGKFPSVLKVNTEEQKGSYEIIPCSLLETMSIRQGRAL